jgi:hypothetical protein
LGDQLVLGEHVARLQGDGPHRAKVDARHRVQVHAQLVGAIDGLGANGPRVQVETAQVSHPHDVGGVAWHQQVGGAPGGEADGGVLVLAVLGGPLLEERLARNPFTPALEHRRAAVHAAQGAIGAADEVGDEVHLGPALLGKQDLARTGDAHGLSRHVHGDHLGPCHRRWTLTGEPRALSR